MHTFALCRTCDGTGWETKTEGDGRFRMPWQVRRSELEEQDRTKLRPVEIVRGKFVLEPRPGVRRRLRFACSDCGGQGVLLGDSPIALFVFDAEGNTVLSAGRWLQQLGVMRLALWMLEREGELNGIGQAYHDTVEPAALVELLTHVRHPVVMGPGVTLDSRLRPHKQCRAIREQAPIDTVWRALADRLQGSAT